MFGAIKNIIKTITSDGDTFYSDYEENADHLVRAWRKTNPENRYEVIEVKDDRTSIVEVKKANPSMWDRLLGK